MATSFGQWLKESDQRYKWPKWVSCVEWGRKYKPHGSWQMSKSDDFTHNLIKSHSTDDVVVINLNFSFNWQVVTNSQETSQTFMKDYRHISNRTAKCVYYGFLPGIASNSRGLRSPCEFLGTGCYFWARLESGWWLRVVDWISQTICAGGSLTFQPPSHQQAHEWRSSESRTAFRFHDSRFDI